MEKYDLGQNKSGKNLQVNLSQVWRHQQQGAPRLEVGTC